MVVESQGVPSKQEFTAHRDSPRNLSFFKALLKPEGPQATPPPAPMFWGATPEGCRQWATWETHLIVLQAVDHQLGENGHTSPAHASAAVDHDGGWAGLGVLQHAVGVSTHRLDLLQVC